MEQVLMRTQDRSEGETTSDGSSGVGGPKETSQMQKKLHKLSRNVTEAIALFKNSLNLADNTSSARDQIPNSSRKVVWGSVVRNLTQLYPGSQLPEKLMSNIRKHYDSLPLRSHSVHHIK